MCKSAHRVLYSVVLRRGYSQLCHKIIQATKIRVWDVRGLEQRHTGYRRLNTACGILTSNMFNMQTEHCILNLEMLSEHGHIQCSFSRYTFVRVRAEGRVITQPVSVQVSLYTCLCVCVCLCLSISICLCVCVSVSLASLYMPLYLSRPDTRYLPRTVAKGHLRVCVSLVDAHAVTGMGRRWSGLPLRS